MSELNAALEHPVYNYKVVRQFAIMTVVWGIVGMLVGVYIAASWSGRPSTSTCPGSASAACARCIPTR
jgi:cbb3-type cytochrome oxidase subunit 1